MDSVIKSIDIDLLCFYRTLFHKTGSEIFILDSSGTVIDVNDAACTFLGYNRESIIGRMIHKNDADILQEITSDKMDEILGKGMLAYETRYTVPDKGAVPVKVNAWTIDMCGNRFVIIAFKNISEGIQSEMQLLKTHSELEKTNIEVIKMYAELKSTQSKMLHSEKMASIGQLAAGVAHEINNPMGFITSNLGSLDKYFLKIMAYIDRLENALLELEDRKIPESCGQLKRQLKIDYIRQDITDLIRESLDGADRVKKIVQNLKTFSRVNETEKQNANMNECLETTLNIVWNELKYKADVKKEYGEIPLVRCYPQELNQVFMNLLINAAQAIKERGEIRIRTFMEDGFVKVSISDTGSGIPKDHMGRLFEPFFTTKEVGKGTGLGLSISYDIVKKHKGEITVESEEGKGSTFTVCIPVREGDGA